MCVFKLFLSLSILHNFVKINFADMKYTLPLFVLLSFSVALKAQDFTGQWKGSFIDKSTKFLSWGGDQCDYVLELETKGNTVSGYSYTYFSDGGKKYYTICRLTGTIDRADKTVEVREVERTKTNVPSNIRNCFQVHKLTYFKQGDSQTLEGEWVPAPNQEGDCGYGSTILTRRVLQRNTALAKATVPVKKTTTSTPVAKPVVKNTVPSRQSTTPAKQPVVKNTVKTPPPVVFKNPNPAKTQPVAKNTVKTPPPPAVKENPVTVVPPSETNVVKDKGVVVIDRADDDPKRNTLGGVFEKRTNTLLKTINIENETFKVDLYDNGDIDGDSISLFFNGKLLLAHKRLSDKALSLTLDVDNEREVNELIMYADNLGSIPPNTALMVITDGNKRYEARISSDLEKSGVIRFVHKPKGTQ